MNAPSAYGFWLNCATDAEPSAEHVPSALIQLIMDAGLEQLEKDDLAMGLQICGGGGDGGTRGRAAVSATTPPCTTAAATALSSPASQTSR